MASDEPPVLEDARGSLAAAIAALERERQLLTQKLAFIEKLENEIIETASSPIPKPAAKRKRPKIITKRP